MGAFGIETRDNARLLPAFKDKLNTVIHMKLEPQFFGLRLNALFLSAGDFSKQGVGDFTFAVVIADDIRIFPAFLRDIPVVITMTVRECHTV
jgi:hypothetical protein